MIIRADDRGLMLIRQTEHARLCGEMARSWGNEHFEPVEPLERVAWAAAEHDNGWAEWEEAPRLNPETRWPCTYTDIPIDQHQEIYRRGIGRAIAHDRYAGLLVSLHGSLLSCRLRAGAPGRASGGRRTSWRSSAAYSAGWWMRCAPIRCSGASARSHASARTGTSSLGGTPSLFFSATAPRGWTTSSCPPTTMGDGSEWPSSAGRKDGSWTPTRFGRLRSCCRLRRCARSGRASPASRSSARRSTPQQRQGSTS